MSRQVDVAIIGAGTAGLAALREVKKKTGRFIIVNSGPYGTTCARVGCMPSKALVEAAKAYHQRTHFEAFGIGGGEALTVDIPAVLARVRRLRDDFVAGTLKATEGLGDRNIAGHARLLGPNTLEVNGEKIQAEKIIIATGSRVRLPEAWGDLDGRLLTSDTLFEATDLPPRMAVIGLGPIGTELGQALARLGIEVTAFGGQGKVAGIEDATIHEAALACLTEEMAVHLGEPATVEATDSGVRVRGAGQEVEVDAVLAAMGRVPQIEGLGLESLGVPLDEQGLPPFDPQTLQIGDLPVFFAGDVNGRMAILHEAADDGHIAGRNATADHPDCYHRRTPLHIVFTDPNIAQVGDRLSRLDPETTLVGEVSFARQGRARTAEKNRGAIRVYAHRHSGMLLGAELCVAEGEHLAHLLALALTRRLTVPELLGMPVYHPVLEEGLRAALRRIARELPEAPASDLASCGDIGADALD